MDSNKQIVRRVSWLYLIMVFAATFILGKIAYIQFVEGEYWKERQRVATLRYETIDAIRGNICADDGSFLATSIPNYEIRMDLSSTVVNDDVFNRGIDSLAMGLARIFGDRDRATYARVLRNARQQQLRYYLVKRNVSYEQLQQARRLPIFRLGRGRGGLIVVEGSRREMPYRTMAARTIGYERQGVYVGLEGSFREYLEGRQGKRLMQRGPAGHWFPINDEEEITPVNGFDLITTININLQDIVENALLRQLRTSDADFGTAILMEVKTGKIKAISNLTKTPLGRYEETFNYAIAETAEPGSTFKLASMMALLEDGKLDFEREINTGTGTKQFANRIMRDVKQGGHGVITEKAVFEHSSNVGTSMMIYDAYNKNPQRFIDRLRSFGLGYTLDLEIAGEGRPILNGPGSSTWSAVSLPWMSIGYEVALTPLQVLAFYNAVANNGRLMKPIFVEEIRQTGRTIKRFHPQIIKRSIASQQTIEKATELLVGVVENGTAKSIRSNLYSIAGKTGTAQVANQREGYRSPDGRRSYRSSFVGFFPANNPQYSCIVVVHNPKGAGYTGGVVAAPVFKEIADKVFATHIEPLETKPTEILIASVPIVRQGAVEDLREIYRVFDKKLIENSQSPWAVTRVNGDTIKLNQKELIENLVPDVTGMSLRDAIYLLENSGLKVSFSGRGIVRRQSLQPGTRIAQGSHISIALN